MSSKPRRILALETSGRIGAAAIGTDAGLLAARQLSGDMRHKSELMPAVAELLGEQGWPGDSLTDVFVSIGPGSFTGLRIGVTITRTLAWSIGAQIVAVPTLDALARNALALNPPPAYLAVMLDAKQAHVFAAAYELRNGTYARVMDACMAKPGEFLQRCPGPAAVLGEGITHHRDAIEAIGATILNKGLWLPLVEYVLQIGLELARAGRFTPARDLIPLYIRRPEPEEKWEQRQSRMQK